MPMLDIQRRNQQTGRIRAGYSEGTGKTGKNGKEIRKPIKLDRFLLSSTNQRMIYAAADRFGGTPEPWEKQWRVITETSELRCSVPGSNAALKQDWEMWNGGVCVRRCNGQTEQLRQAPCLCPEDIDERRALAKQGKACGAKTRINLILPDLPGLGVWRLDTSSWNATLEIGGIAELLAKARDTGVIVPAILRLEQRETTTLIDAGIRPDKRRGIEGERVQKRAFYVPVLDPLPTPHEMLALASQPLAAALPPPMQPMKAITAGRPADRTPPHDQRVTPPASWTTPTAPTPAETADRKPQHIADDVIKATTRQHLHALWDEVTRQGWQQEYVSTNPDDDAALMDTLQVMFETAAKHIDRAGA